MSEGWAAVEDGRILVDTVSPHERAAMVNWLWVYAGVPVSMLWSEADIREAFHKRAPARKTTAQRVTIEVGE